MTHALNMTIPLKQDPESQKKLQELKRDFATKYQPKMDKALRDSEIVHFARVVVIGDKFLQVITEYEGDHKGYTEFFRKALPEVFDAIFSLAEGAPGFASSMSNPSSKSPKAFSTDPWASRPTARKTARATARATCFPPMGAAP